MKGEFLLIMGPMASGKSRTLITELEKYEYAKKRVVAIQPALNVRDEGLISRNGLSRQAVKLKELGNYTDFFSLENTDVIGIDEIFMFEPGDAFKVVKEFLTHGKTVVAASLDISAMGNIQETIPRLLELAPDIKHERAVCTTCDEMDARFTIIYDTKTNEPIREGLPDVLPDDGSVGYRPVCRNCFFGWSA